MFPLRRVSKRFLQYKPSKPQVNQKLTTIATAEGSKAASPTVQNGLKDQPIFPKGTIGPTLRQRFPYFVAGLIAIAVAVGWPTLFVTSSDTINKVPPRGDTALVQNTKDGYQVAELAEVHRDVADDDDE